MANRSSQTILLVEYIPSNDYTRSSQNLLLVEYTPATNYSRSTQEILFVEYLETNLLYMIRANIAANNAFRSGGRQ